MNGGKCFFDSNVLLYAIDLSQPIKRKRAIELLLDCIANGTGAISAQLMQECLNVTYKVSPTDSQMRQSLIENLLLPLYQLDSNAQLIASAVEIKDRWQYSFYDSMIIAAAIGCAATTLYTEDMHHGQRIENLTIINPFI